MLLRGQSREQPGLGWQFPSASERASEGGLVREGRKRPTICHLRQPLVSPARIVKFEGKNDQTWSDWGSVALHGGAAFVERTSQGRQDGGGGGGAHRIPGRLAGYLDHLGLITLADHSHWQPAGPALSTPTHPSFPHLPRELTRPGFAQPFHGRPRAENEAMPPGRVRRLSRYSPPTRLLPNRELLCTSTQDADRWSLIVDPGICITACRLAPVRRGHRIKASVIIS